MGQNPIIGHPVPGVPVQQGQAQTFEAALAGRYRIERELGHGGMATVYLAQDLKYPRKVAIKVLRPEIAALLGHDRFMQEVQLVASMTHPNILTLLDSDEAAGMLFYVMPYVAEGTLQDRILREGQIPVAEALDIGRQVAGALAYAHQFEHARGKGIVHRDIKPGNILLLSGHAYVTDFGIARVMDAITGDSGKVTTALGTVGYMPPEQLTGDAIDGRADEYALGVVLYESLCGSLPQQGAGAARRGLETLRPDVPPAAVEALARALAPAAEDRFPAMADFAKRLDSTTVQLEMLAPRRRSRAFRVVKRWSPRVVAGLVVAAALGLWLRAGHPLPRFAPAAPADTTRYAVLPFEYQGNVPSLHEAQLLRDALARWQGVMVIDPFKVREAVRGKDSASLAQVDAARLARGAGAGRYLRGVIGTVGDSIRVTTGLYDATNGAMLADQSLRLSSDMKGIDSAFDDVADHLLLRGLLPDTAHTYVGTKSLPARQAFARGQQAMETWDLAKADTAFTLATTFDQEYAEAQLWVALARAWSGADSPRWRVPAEQALAGQANLSADDKSIADAVAAQARGDLGKACRVWDQMARARGEEYVSWYGAAFCLRSDDAVVPDPVSPSGWRFRASYEQVVRAYRRAFALHPAILSAFRGNAFQAARSVLLSVTTRGVRPGTAIGAPAMRFYARPQLWDDTLVLVPYPASEALGAKAPWDPRRVELAVTYERALFHDIAMSWVAKFPTSPAALQALAVSLDLLGDPAALDTLRRARSLARTLSDSVTAACAEVWTLVRLGAPGDTMRIRLAKAIADSLLAASTPDRRAEPGGLATIAVLTGRAGTAVRLARQSFGLILPGRLAESAPALLTFAALGGPVDSLRSLERVLVDQLSDSSLPQRDELQATWLVRSARLAAPILTFPSSGSQAGSDYLLQAQAALTRGDTGLVRGMLKGLRGGRRWAPPSELPLDALYPEAVLFVRLHDEAGAIGWLDPTLNSLAGVVPGTFDFDVGRAGALMNAMVLRADLAQRAGDRNNARRWAAAVSILWADADSFLQPVVARMHRLAS